MEYGKIYDFIQLNTFFFLFSEILFFAESMKYNAALDFFFF